jgi:hypothetical protein
MQAGQVNIDVCSRHNRECRLSTVSIAYRQGCIFCSCLWDVHSLTIRGHDWLRIVTNSLERTGGLWMRLEFYVPTIMMKNALTTA